MCALYLPPQNGESSSSIRQSIPSQNMASPQSSPPTLPYASLPGPDVSASEPLPKFVEDLFKTDIQDIKQELHDVLGESGLPYWKAVNGYLLGQVGRGELETLVRKWLKGKVQLHNRLVLALLYHAGLPASHGHWSKKRKRIGPDDPEYDLNDNIIEPKLRVQNWMSCIGGRERARIRRAVIGRQQEDEAPSEDDIGFKGWGVQAGTTMPPLATSARVLPASHQLSHRLSQLAKAYDLNLSPDALGDIGEFMAVGMDAHLSDILHSYVHLYAQGTEHIDSLRVPPGLERSHHSQLGSDEEVKVEEGELPQPDLSKLRDLFSLNPSLHPTTSPVVYKLLSSLLLSETEFNNPSTVKEEEKPTVPEGPEGDGRGASNARAHEESEEERVTKMTKRLVDDGLVKMDNVKKGEEDGGGGSKKDRKHNLHWRYEDPAILLKDVFG